MYVINEIPEFRKNRNRDSDFRLERFSGFPIIFSAGKFRNSELRSGIPISGCPRNLNPKSEFPTKLANVEEKKREEGVGADKGKGISGAGAGRS
jgi:hypothetical protein